MWPEHANEVPRARSVGERGLGTSQPGTGSCERGVHQSGRSRKRALVKACPDWLGAFEPARAVRSIEPVHPLVVQRQALAFSNVQQVPWLPRRRFAK